MKKNKLLRILALVLTLSLCMPHITVMATEVSGTEGPSFYFRTAACPNGYIEYVVNNIERVLSGTDPAEIPEFGVITVGQPFSFLNEGSDIFYFPLLCNNEIVFLYRVYLGADGEYHGILSKHLVEELNEIASLSSVFEPLEIIMEDNVIKAYIGDTQHILYVYPEEETSGKKNILHSFAKMAETSTQTINVLSGNETITLAYYATRGQTQNRDSTPTSKYLGNINDIAERQTTKPWCTAYCVAYIVRYLLGCDTLAVDVMHYFYPSPTLLPTHTMSINDAVEYAHYRGLDAYKTNRPISDPTMITQINLSQPVFVVLENQVPNASTNEHGLHAVVLRGYDYPAGTWSIWNPWYLGFETWDMGDTYVPSGYSASVYEYEHYKDIYGWSEQ